MINSHLVKIDQSVFLKLDKSLGFCTHTHTLHLKLSDILCVWILSRFFLSLLCTDITWTETRCSVTIRHLRPSCRDWWLSMWHRTTRWHCSFITCRAQFSSSRVMSFSICFYVLTGRFLWFQNSPNDLQMLSDAPAHHLFCLLPPVPPTQNSLPEVLAVIQVRRNMNFKCLGTVGQYSMCFWLVLKRTHLFGFS